MIGFFFFNDTATTEIYTLSLHDALPIFDFPRVVQLVGAPRAEELRELTLALYRRGAGITRDAGGSGEHTSEIQSRPYLVCRLLLGKKTNTSSIPASISLLNANRPALDQN